MPTPRTDEFHMLDWSEIEQKPSRQLTDTEKYDQIVKWAIHARNQNPNVFDSLTEWILDDSEWGPDKLAENEQILMRGVLARFREQNAKLRAYLMQLEPSGVVNGAVFTALDQFDKELSGVTQADYLRGAVAKVFADFSAMQDRGVRRLIAGEKTGPEGVNSVEIFGYINILKDCDATVQWALFMPSLVKNQLKGFQVDHFAYQTLPAVRLIGRECGDVASAQDRDSVFRALDDLRGYQSDFPYDVLFMHHYGLGVDKGPWHGVWGRFMKPDTPLPEGFLSFDFTMDDDNAGPPYCPQFALAIFSGDTDAMHQRDGYDSDAMYDVTRNIILGQGVSIPYPGKYWYAEVFLDGHNKPGSAYMFSVTL
jgi:hypothetical protein